MLCSLENNYCTLQYKEAAQFVQRPEETVVLVVARVRVAVRRVTDAPPVDHPLPQAEVPPRPGVKGEGLAGGDERPVVEGDNVDGVRVGLESIFTYTHVIHKSSLMLLLLLKLLNLLLNSFFLYSHDSRALRRCGPQVKLLAARNNLPSLRRTEAAAGIDLGTPLPG